MRIIIVSGSSGSGKSSALNQLEDMGFYCVENLPVTLVESLISHFTQTPSSIYTGLAICIDIRTEDKGVSDLRDFLKVLRDRVTFELIFFDATEQVLNKRFNETRRRHPLSENGLSLTNALAVERILLEPIISEADLIIDTSEMTPYNLREVMEAQFSKVRSGMAITVESFGFKKGAPLNADIVLDMRMLANPHWDPELRPYTGQTPQVKQFIEAHPETESVANDVINMLLTWVPLYQKSQRAYLNIAIGCTGGKHRSVYMTERVGKVLAQHYEGVLVTHRDMPKD